MIISIFCCMNRRMLRDAMDARVTLDKSIAETNRDMANTAINLDVLERQIEDLIEYANSQKKDVEEEIQEDIVGAYNTIKANDKR